MVDKVYLIDHCSIRRELTCLNTERSGWELWNKGERDLQQIADLTDLPLDEVKKLFEGKTA